MLSYANHEDGGEPFKIAVGAGGGAVVECTRSSPPGTRVVFSYGQRYSAAPELVRDVALMIENAARTE